MSLHDKLDLPPFYALDESERPFLHILQPSGRRIPGLVFASDPNGHTPNPHLVNEAVWMWHIDTEELILGADAVMGRSEYSGRPSVHDLLCEVLDGTMWTGAEKQAWLESFHAAAERDLARRCSTDRSGGWGAA